MKKIKWSKKLSFTISFLIFIPIILNACGQINYNTVIFATAQGIDWPIMVPLNKAINYYNQKFANQTDFLPIKLLNQNNNGGAKTESELLNNTINQISANDPQTPSIILNTYTASAAVNSYNRLLDVSEFLKSTDFASDFIPMYTTVPNQKNLTKRLYSLPLNLSSLETLVINLFVLKFLFDIAVANGATLIKEKSGIVFDVNQIKSEDAKNRLINANSAFSRFDYPIINTENKDNSSKKNLIGYSISNDTFKFYDQITEFANKIEPLLKLKNNNEFNPQTNKIANIISADYFNNILYRYLWVATGENPKTYIYHYKSDLEKNQVNIVDYALLNDSKIGNIFVNNFNQFNKNFLPFDAKKGLKSINYATKNGTDWTPNYIRQFDAAIGIAPSVAMRSSAQTDAAKRFFATNPDGSINNKKFNNFGKLNLEVKWYNQLMYTHKNKNSKNQEITYMPGGSSLTPIKTNLLKDKATLKFLQWLYLNKINVDNQLNPVADQSLSTKQIFVTEFLEANSGYFIPTAANYGTLEKTQNHLKQILAKANGLDDHSVLNAALGLSVNDYIHLLKIKNQTPYVNNQTKSPLFYQAGDINTAAFEDFFDQSISAMSQNIKNPKILNGETFLKIIKNKFKNL